MSHFKILLGKSSGGQAHPSLSDWLSKVDRNVEVHEDAQGTTYYLIGDFTSPHRAREYMDQLIEMDFEPIDYFPLIDGRAMPHGWEGRIEIGEKKSELTPDNS